MRPSALDWSPWLSISDPGGVDVFKDHQVLTRDTDDFKTLLSMFRSEAHESEVLLMQQVAFSSTYNRSTAAKTTPTMHN